MNSTPQTSWPLHSRKFVPTRFGLGVLLLLLAHTWAGCGNEKTMPTAATPTPSPSARVTGIAISGNLILTTIGETTQLSAIVSFSDGTTKDVTSEGKWSVSNSGVLTIGPSGLVTVVGFGASLVTFANPAGNMPGGQTTVRATPPGTFAVLGAAREPGAGGLANVFVVDTLSGRSATTDAHGQFALAELPRLELRLKAEKDGYEPAEVDAIPGGQYPSIQLRLARTVRLLAGQVVTPAGLAPNDLEYTLGSHRCVPCRLIRVVVPQTGSVNIRVTWTPVGVPLSLLVDGRVVADGSSEMTAEIVISAPREVLMYLGAVSPYPLSMSGRQLSFTFETSMR